MQKLNEGFTLIELLVVVLIIGILAAVALPQYQKAVEKSRAVQALTLLKSLGQELDSHILATGDMLASFDELAVSAPNWQGTTRWYTGLGSNTEETRSNNTWSIQLVPVGVYMGLLEGPYKGAGFVYYAKNNFDMPMNKIICAERTTDGITFSKDQGDYCTKLLKGTFIGHFGSLDAFTID